jgi:hypothetical protein
LEKKYGEIGYSIKEFKFNPLLLFSCHLHKQLERTVKDIMENHDVIHCQSGGYFPLVHLYVDQNIRKPFILESPVLRSSTGTLLAGLNISKSYDVKDNAIVQKLLDTFSFTPEWTAKTISNIQRLKDSNQILMLASHSDTVSDNRGKHELYHHIFEKGQHGRLFYENDFDIIKEYLENHATSALGGHQQDV